MGRPGVPPGVFFRMLFVGYFEGLQSHRAIAWRCSDSRSLGDFLGLAPTDAVPNNSCVSKTHKRLQKEVFDGVFRFILSVAAHKGLLWGEAIGIDSTTIQANASMRSIVRKDSGKGWKDYPKKLAKKAGLENPTDDELRQFDRTRPGKKVSNDDWENPHDPDAAITRMKDGTTRMGYKAKYAASNAADTPQGDLHGRSPGACGPRAHRAPAKCGTHATPRTCRRHSTFEPLPRNVPPRLAATSLFPTGDRLGFLPPKNAFTLRCSRRVPS
jgi:hypothetical protein